MRALRVNLRHLRRGRPRPRHAAAESQRSGFGFHGWFVSFASLDRLGFDEIRRRAQIIPVWPL